MSPRRFAVAALLSLSALSAGAREMTVPLRAEARIELRELFALAPGVVTEDENGISVGAFAVEVVVARIDADGKLVRACVDTEEAARLFLEKPLVQKEAQDR
jgi:hypothetical protein